MANWRIMHPDPHAHPPRQLTIVRPHTHSSVQHAFGWVVRVVCAAIPAATAGLASAPVLLISASLLLIPGPLLLACATKSVVPSGTVEIPGGPFYMGSSLDERARAVEITQRAEPSADAVAAVKREFRRTSVKVEGFHIMRTPVTQAQYLRYARATGSPEPYVDRRTWERHEHGIDYSIVQRFLWRDGAPPTDRLDHPVVLVSQVDAAGYCDWWGKQFGRKGTLPSEAQWEKSARGSDGRAYPWGNRYDPQRLNARETNIGDTVPAGSYSESASPYGVLDMAGNVFEWTRTRGKDANESFVVKGGAWNSDGASARAAARHTRPQSLRHVSIGFRCVAQ